MTKNEQFLLQKEEVSRAFSEIVNKPKFIEWFEKDLKARTSPQCDGLIRSLFNNKDFSKAMRKAEFKFKDMALTYTISNGEDEAEASHKNITFCDVVDYEHAGETYEGNEWLRKCDLITAFNWGQKGSEMFKWENALHPEYRKFSNGSIHFEYPNLITRKMLNTIWSDDHITEGNGEWLIDVL